MRRRSASFIHHHRDVDAIDDRDHRRVDRDHRLAARRQLLAHRDARRVPERHDDVVARPGVEHVGADDQIVGRLRRRAAARGLGARRLRDAASAAPGASATPGGRSPTRYGRTSSSLRPSACGHFTVDQTVPATRPRNISPLLPRWRRSPRHTAGRGCPGPGRSTLRAPDPNATVTSSPARASSMSLATTSRPVVRPVGVARRDQQQLLAVQPARLARRPHLADDGAANQRRACRRRAPPAARLIPGAAPGAVIAVRRQLDAIDDAHHGRVDRHVVAARRRARRARPGRRSRRRPRRRRRRRSRPGAASRTRARRWRAACTTSSFARCRRGSRRAAHTWPMTRPRITATPNGARRRCR